MIYPDWPAAVPVKAVTTTRHGGVSTAPYDSLNLADHVGDAAGAVRQNR
jgi:copper oxidase (laccase) domain-containing protein